MCGHRAWLTWMDGRSGAAGTGGKRRAADRNRWLGRRRGRGLRGRTDGRARGYKQGLANGRRTDGQADGPNRDRFWLGSQLSQISLPFRNPAPPEWNPAPNVTVRSSCYHGLQGSASATLTATGYFNKKWQILTPPESTALSRSPKKFFTGNYAGNLCMCTTVHML